MDATDIPARWFDGVHDTPHDARLRIADGHVELAAGDAGPRRYPLASLQPAERLPGLPLALGLPDGGSLWVDGIDGPLAGLQRRSLATWLTARLWAAVACMVLLVASVVALDRWVIGWAADTVLHVVPRSVDESIGKKVLLGADASWLRQTKIPYARREEILKRFYPALARGAPGVAVTVDFRRMRDEGGINAFALPGETIILLDGLVAELEDDELMLVLAHEVGHVANRDGMRSLARSLGIGAVASTLWGDFSSWAVMFGGITRIAAHSRRTETTADSFMRDFARRNNIDPRVEKRLWERLEELQEEEGDGDTGGAPGWLSSHPSSQERRQAADRAMGKPAGR